MGDDSSIESNDKSLVQGLLSALDPFSKIRSDDTVPFRLVITFLNIVADEGRCANEYAKILGIHRFMMGRYIHDLADRARDGGPGLGLVLRPSGCQFVGNSAFAASTLSSTVVTELARARNPQNGPWAPAGWTPMCHYRQNSLNRSGAV